MKTKIIVLLFMTLISFLVKAETTYRNDHDVCTLKGETIDFDLRSLEQYSVSEDDDYGQIAFLKNKGKTSRIDLRDMGIGRFRMLKLNNDICPKILTISSNDDEVAFFLMKDNRPFADLMIILFYNVKTHVSELIATNLPVKSAISVNKKFFFKVAKINSELKSGTIQIKEQKYNYIERPLEPWVSFDGKHFKLDPDQTYDKFEHKNLLKKSELQNLKNFKDAIYTIAINPTLKKQCLSFNKSEWVCN